MSQPPDWAPTPQPPQPPSGQPPQQPYGPPPPQLPQPYGPALRYGPGGPVPAPPAKRFAGRWVALGVLLGVLGVIGLPALLLGLGSSFGNHAGLALSGFGVGFFAPLLVGLVLVPIGSPARRGVGLGLIIGWGAGLVIGGGLCVALIVVLSNGYGG